MKLSIIMSCFNAEETLARALDSIFMQRVSFDYEVIIINDASTDSTPSIIEHYHTEHSEIRVINNPLNCGYAMSIYYGLCAAKSDYFCLLDSDDYYTVQDKIARQVDFLDRDVKEEYVAVATEYIVDLGKDMVHIPPRTGRKEMSYVDRLTFNTAYYHTATYVYRNIFRGNVPELFKRKCYEGDTPMSLFLLFFSHRKVRILDFVGSVYTYEYKGIWSGLTEKEQQSQTLTYLNALEKNLQTELEKRYIEKKIAICQAQLSQASDSVHRVPSAVTTDECLARIKAYTDKFAFEQEDFMRGGLYASEYLDSLVVSIGYIKRARGAYRIYPTNPNAVCIVVGDLCPDEGGILREISQLIELYSNQNVYLFLTGMKELPVETLQFAEAHSNLTTVFSSPDEGDRLGFFLSRLAEISPYRTYYYCSHNDVYGTAMMKSAAGCENIALFSFDCGYICGIHNPNLDTIAARRPVDYYLLKRYFGEKVIYIPVWESAPKDCSSLAYKPFDGHNALVTASGAAQFHEDNVQFSLSYTEFIIQLLKYTQGVHYHYGPIPEDNLEAVYEKMTLLGVPHSRFVHVPRVANMPRDLLERHVDIFIGPFPVVSYKMTCAVMSVGIPVICWDGIQRASIADFVPPEMPKWRTFADFITIMCSLDKEHLAFLSVLSKTYFEEHFSTEVVMPVLIDKRSFPVQLKSPCSDDVIQDISSCLRMFGETFQITVK